jgi:hypothetical protein
MTNTRTNVPAIAMAFSDHPFLSHGSFVPHVCLLRRIANFFG